MTRHVRSWALAALVVVCTSSLTSAYAGIVLTTPSGLAPGAHFRFAYVTPTSTDATSNSISTYNTFVNSSENTDNATYEGTAVHWSAVASVSGVNASANVGTYNYPVYLYNGSRVVSSDANLWNGTTLDNNIGSTLSGGSPQDDNIWTGSQSDGTAYNSQTLGSAKPRYGRDDYVDSHWIDMGGNQNAFLSTRNLPLFGISDVLTVPAAAVPEIDPAMGGSALSLVAGVLAMIEQRRRRAMLVA